MTQMIIELLPFILPVIFLTLLVGLFALIKQKESEEVVNERVKAAQLQGASNLSLENIKLFENQKEKLLEVKLDEFFKDLGKKQGVSTSGLQKLLGGVSGGAALVLLLGCWVVGFLILKVVLALEIIEGIFLGLPMGIMFAVILLKQYQHRREKEFLQNFPIAFDIIARGLKAGGSIEKTFKTVERELEGPVSVHFGRINEQIDFGVPFEEAMVNAAERIQIDDFSFFSIALIIQRKAGGSLSELVSNISTFLRKRSELRMKVHALSAEAKATGIIVGSLPVAILLVMYFINPEHIDTFRHDPAGRKLAFFIFFYMLTGILIIRKMTHMKV